MKMKKIKRAENSLRERERERERERKREIIYCVSDVMTVENVKDHRKMSTKLSFLFISLFSIDCAQ